MDTKETQELGMAQFLIAQPRLPTLSSLGKLQQTAALWWRRPG